MQHQNDPNNQSNPNSNQKAEAPQNSSQSKPTPTLPVVIPPTIGRVVWYTPSKSDISGGATADPSPQKLKADVVYVWNDRLVNLFIVNTNGIPFARTSVQLAQEGDPFPTDGGYCSWMPFQLGQVKTR